MEKDIVAVQFIWLPNEDELPAISSAFQSKQLKHTSQNEPLQALKRFLCNLLDCPVKITDFKPKITFSNAEDDYGASTPTTMFFAKYLFMVSTEIKFKKKNIETDYDYSDRCKKIINIFCTKRDNNFPNLWLDIDFLHLLTDPLSTKNSFISLKSFALGNIVKLNKFIEHFNSENALNSCDFKITQVKVKFLHDEEMLHVYFVVGNSKVHVKKRSPLTHKMFRLIFPYSSLHTILVSHGKPFSAYIRLYKSPLLFCVQQDEDAKNYISYLDLSPHTKWLRTVELCEKCPSHIKKEFSMNSVLCLNFSDDEYELLKIALRHKSVQIYFTYMSVIPFVNVQPSLHIPDFDCYYGFHCLLSHSYELLDNLMDKKEMDIFKNFVIAKCKENPKALSNSFYTVYSAINRCNVIILNHSLKSLYEKYSQSKSSADPFYLNDSDKDLKMKNRGEEKIIIVKRAVILPTHIKLLPPQPILKSRALRSCDSDFSLRITIRDVNLETINFSFKGFSEEGKKHLTEFFETYYKKPMLKGINIGKRKYEYVGSSTSQLRGHGLWFYAKDNDGKTATKLREDFGNMAKIKEVPKYMARMGQTFSQALGRITVSQKFTNVDFPEQDVTGGIKEYLSEDEFGEKKYLKPEQDTNESENQEPYTFSDGIGQISEELTEMIYVELEVEESRPSAMQIRYAGCKGMLVVNPDLKGKKIVFRESMKKFSSEDESLEILKFSEKRNASLNRPLITILEQLGISKKVFVKLQKDMIQSHIKSMFYEPEACDFLNRNSKLRFDFIRMHKNGICFTEDPLFRSMIYGLFQKQLNFMKNKANIELPVNKGRSMFGVLDETKTLEYGEVFVQYTDWITDELKIIEGTIVVTKNPCMHPGDVRKFKAVHVEKLTHIKDCIVFPAKGHRPHPDEMAGSDLDGDEYHVMWYEDFIFERQNEPPMHFAVKKETSKDLGRRIEPADELEHLCNYIVNDNVGLIANAHLVFADKEKNGIFGENCIRLAKKYAIALDFAKSGRTVSRDKKDKTFSYPDFMQKFGERDTYISKNALGVLYRNCKRLEIGLETTNSEISFTLDSDLVHENWQKYQKSALRMYKKYCQKVEYLLNIYSFDCEGQLLAGAIINPPQYYTQRHDLDNLMTLLEYEVQGIFNDLQKMFFQEFGGKPKDHLYTEEMFQKASAWYMVAYSNVPGKTNNFFGLPWAVTDILINLKAQKCKLKTEKAVNCKSLLEQTIDQSLSCHLPDMSENSDTRTMYKNRFEVLDVASKVLSKWLKTQKSHILNPNMKDFQKLIDKEFESVSEPLMTCSEQYIENLRETNNLKKALSPAHYVIETLLQLACIKSSTSKYSFNDVQQELGLLSWVTLIKLACTYNPHYLGITDKHGNIPSSILYLPQDNVISTFKVHLFEKDDYNEQFSVLLLHEPEKVVKYLMKVSKLKNVQFRCDIDIEKKFVAIFTVMGTRYAIEKIKDIVILDEFFEWVVKDKNLFDMH